MSRVVALVDDLFFISKMLETAKHVGAELKTAANIASLLELIHQSPATLVIVDLNSRAGGINAIEQLRAAGHTTPIVAFLSHVQVDLAQQAQAAGATQVLPRSKFTQHLADILKSV